MTEELKTQDETTENIRKLRIKAKERSEVKRWKASETDFVFLIPVDTLVQNTEMQNLSLKEIEARLSNLALTLDWAGATELELSTNLTFEEKKIVEMEFLKELGITEWKKDLDWDGLFLEKSMTTAPSDLNTIPSIIDGAKKLLAIREDHEFLGLLERLCYLTDDPRSSLTDWEVGFIKGVEIKTKFGISDQFCMVTYTVSSVLHESGLTEYLVKTNELPRR